jgi:rhodanese-related sulfurtransferase
MLNFFRFMFSKYNENEYRPIQCVDVTQAEVMSNQGALLLDVRGSGDFENGHAPNSKSIPLGVLKARLKEIEIFKDKPVAVICHSESCSKSAVRILQAEGFSQAFNVTGGMSSWKYSGLEVMRLVKLFFIRIRSTCKASLRANSVDKVWLNICSV